MTTFQLLAIKEPSQQNFAWGSGFVISADEAYYLVTAKHVFYPPSTQADYTIPTFANSAEQVLIMDQNEAPLHKESLVNFADQTLLYRTHNIQGIKALDVAVLKLTDAPDEIKNVVVSYSALIENSDLVQADVIIEGYPTKNAGYHSVAGKVLSREYQEMLDDDANYFFIMETESDLKGMSGSPVFNSSKTQIVGVFVGQNRKHPSLGYVVYASYIREIISSF